MPDIPKFRYLDEAIRMVDKMDEELNETQQIINQQQKVLSYLKRPKDEVKAALNKKSVTAALEIFKITRDPADAKRMRTLRKTADPKLTKVVVPSVSKLKSQYKILEDLYSKFQTLESLETQIGMQFKDARDLQRAIRNIRLVKNKVQKQMKEVFSYLNDVANAHVPKAFQEYTEAIVNEIQEHVPYLKAEQFRYVTTSSEGSLVFTEYIVIIDAVNDEGETTPHLYISIQWVVGSDNEPSSVRVFLNHDFELPNELLTTHGPEVGNVAEAVRAIANLLDMEDFSSSLGVIPLALQLKMDPKLLTKDLFSYREYIDKVGTDAENNALVFALRKNAGVDKDSARKIAHQLFVEIRGILKKAKNTKITSTIEQKNGQFFIIFKIKGKAVGNEMTTYDLEFMRDKFNLNDTQLRKIANIMKG